MKSVLSSMLSKKPEAKDVFFKYNHAYSEAGRFLSKDVFNYLEDMTEKELYDLSTLILFNSYVTIQKLTDKSLIRDSDTRDYFTFIISDVIKHLPINLKDQRYYTKFHEEYCVCGDIRNYVIMSQSINYVFKVELGLPLLFDGIEKLNQFSLENKLVNHH